MRSCLFLLSFILICLLVCTCKKEKDEKYCWQIIDGVGNNWGVVCDKTEAELLACVKNRSCGVFATTDLSSCNYYKAGGEEYCWFVDGRYMIKATENKLAHLKRCFGLSSSMVKVDCNYCQFWYNRKKSTYKPDGRFAYSPVRYQQYCGDTVRTLYQGRQVILKDDADSLVVIQFSNDGVNW